jgi:hypothetical protein
LIVGIYSSAKGLFIYRREIWGRLYARFSQLTSRRGKMAHQGAMFCLGKEIIIC